MASLLSFQIRQEKERKSEDEHSGLPSPPNSFCGEQTQNEERRDSLQTSFKDMSIKEDYSVSLPENYTIDHSLLKTKKHIATATAAATGGLTIRNRRPSDISLIASPKKKNLFSRGLSKSYNEIGQYRCNDCGKSYKSLNCLQKHRWEHSEEWEITKKLPLTKHQQVQMLEAAAILIGIRPKLEEHLEKEESDDEESIVIDDEEEDKLSIGSNDSSGIFMEDL